MPLRLEAYDSLFIVFREATTQTKGLGGPDSNFTSWEDVQAIEGPWEVSFDPKWGGPAEPVRFEKLTDWIEHHNPGIRHYSGRAVYRTRFTWEGTARQTMAIELGEVRGVGMARVR